MKALVCEAPHNLGVVNRETPKRQPGEVMVHIRRVGFCGTDYHIFTGTQPFLTYPRVMGHELAGTVVEADADSGFAAGQLVTLNPYLPCGACIACRKAKPNCCVNIRVLGVHADGGMTEFLCVPADAVIAVDGLSLDQAAMVEFLSIGAHAVRRAAVNRGERVLVTGAGPIGIAVALFAAMDGAEVTLIDTSEERLDHARTTVTAAIVRADETLSDALAARTDGEFFDAVFDCTGSAKAIEAGFAFVAHGGRYVLVSVVKDTISFADPEFHKREMQLIGSRNATREDFERVIAAIRSGDVPTKALHTHSFDLWDAPAHLPVLMAERGKVLKAIATL